MRAQAPSRLLVTGLILAAGLGAAAAAAPDPEDPGLPAADALTAGTAWHAAAATPPAALPMRSRQWLLDDGAGHQALLYVGATARPRALLGWSGELGYEGAGYVVIAQQDGLLRLAGGRQVAVGDATVRHLGDHRLLRSAVVGPSGVGRRGWDLLLPAAWDQLRGQPAAYYVVRVAVADDADAGARADSVLAAVLTRLAATSGSR
jgi:hypothetical protein